MPVLGGAFGMGLKCERPLNPLWAAGANLRI
jgi:hypothetical protein